MKRSPATRMVEDYVTLIWKAHEWPGGEPSTTDLVSRVINSLTVWDDGVCRHLLWRSAMRIVRP